MPQLTAPRFFGEQVLESCFSGHRIYSGSGDPPETIKVLQQALVDLGYAIDVDGAFGTQTGNAVTAYKTAKGLVPNDPVVGAGTVAALDADFAHELFDATAAALSGTRFDLGARIGTRADLESGFATCLFERGIGVEIGHLIAYAMPHRVVIAWMAAGGPDGTFGAPTSSPREFDYERSVQEFELVAHIFGGLQDFTLPRVLWEASLSGGALIGKPLGAPIPLGEGGTTFVPHETGVVLHVPGESPQPLPQPVFALWSEQEAAGASLGPPTAFGFPTPAGLTFAFRFGTVTLNEAGVASLVGSLSEDLQRFFQPEDGSLFLFRPMLSNTATHLIGGEAFFKSLRADIASTDGAEDFVYILSWYCDLNFVELTPNVPLGSLLESRVAAGVQVRAMLWAGDPVPKARGFGPQAEAWNIVKEYVKSITSRKVNEPAVNFINGLAGPGRDAAAILDDRHADFGSHHQKVLVIKAGTKVIAYVGGMEVNPDRVNSVPGEKGSPLFDVSVRLENAAAWLVLLTFLRRWELHPARHGAPLRGGSMLPPPQAGSLVVQVTHTYAPGFPFFRTHVRTAATALANGVKCARKFFYFECQYFVGTPALGSAIRDALTANEHLVGIVVIAAEDSVGDLPDLPFRRRDFIRPIVTQFPTRFMVFERLGQGSTTGPGAYVHSKLLIVDDAACLIGSVNSSRRSWSHDSEVDATIVDKNGAGGTAPGTRGWVRELRCDIWSRHLAVPAASLGPVAADLDRWRGVKQGTVIGASVRPYNDLFVPPRFHNLPTGLLQSYWDVVADPS